MNTYIVGAKECPNWVDFCIEQGRIHVEKDLNGSITEMTIENPFGVVTAVSGDILVYEDPYIHLIPAAASKFMKGIKS